MDFRLTDEHCLLFSGKGQASCSYKLQCTLPLDASGIVCHIENEQFPAIQTEHLVTAVSFICKKLASGSFFGTFEIFM